MIWFLTGTDTDAGKTAVARAILQAGRARGLRAAGYKPIESGCSEPSGGADTHALAWAAGHTPDCSYSLRDPVAPALAAARDGVSVELDRIVQHTQELRASKDLIVIEGAGGFLAPLTSTKTVADLVTLLRLPLLIVAPDKLGTINHSLLTIEAARARGLQIDALILSATDTETQELGNQEQIREHSDVPVLSMPRCREEAEWRAAGEKLLLELLPVAP